MGNNEKLAIELNDSLKLQLEEMESFLALSGEELRKKWIDFYRANIGGFDPDNAGEEMGMIKNNSGEYKSDEEVKEVIQHHISYLKNTGRIRL